MSSLLQVRDLRIHRSGVLVLQVDALDVEAGEVLALVGPNGAGKTTLLLALAQLLGRQDGEITFSGRRVRDWDQLDYRRRISLVFQNPMLLDMSVADNVALGLKFRGLPKEEVRERVRHWLQRLGIDNLAHRRAVELSGGEAQRVSLARAFALEPELLFLDEPFPGLDPPARASLLDDLAALLTEDHRTAILVTHNLREAAKLSDRVAVIVAGELRQVGPARQIKSRPADPEVAEFLRSMPR
jgi:ABC-type sulfate/molybdate transport systems ATPase subunit